MASVKNFYNQVKGLKVKELPAHVKPMLSIDYLKNSVKRGLDNYHAKYIQTSSIDPLYHVCFGGMIFSYLVALPEERRHLEHQQHAKEHGGHWLGVFFRCCENLLLCRFFFRWFSDFFRWFYNWYHMTQERFLFFFFIHRAIWDRVLWIWILYCVIGIVCSTFVLVPRCLLYHLLCWYVKERKMLSFITWLEINTILCGEGWF